MLSVSSTAKAQKEDYKQMSVSQKCGGEKKGHESKNKCDRTMSLVVSKDISRI
jgi:hypothetical protein